MACNCKECKYHDIDFIWDKKTDDEISFEKCKKGHKWHLYRKKIKCPYFKKYVGKPYIEKDTECDKCKYFIKCKSNGDLVECTAEFDSRKHYIRSWVACCYKKFEHIANYKLSELFGYFENAGVKISDGLKGFLIEMIEKYGDITVQEFYEDTKFGFYK